MKITYDVTENAKNLNTRKIVISILILIFAVSVRIGITNQFTDSNDAVSVCNIIESGISGQTEMKEALDTAYRQAFKIDNGEAIFVFSTGEDIEKSEN